MIIRTRYSMISYFSWSSIVFDRTFEIIDLSWSSRIEVNFLVLQKLCFLLIFMKQKMCWSDSMTRIDQKSCSIGFLLLIRFFTHQQTYTVIRVVAYTASQSYSLISHHFKTLIIKIYQNKYWILINLSNIYLSLYFCEDYQVWS